MQNLSVDVRPIESEPVGAELLGHSAKWKVWPRLQGESRRSLPASHPGEPEASQEMDLSSPADGEKDADQQGGANALLSSKWECAMAHHVFLL